MFWLGIIVTSLIGAAGFFSFALCRAAAIREKSLHQPEPHED